jgi:hypothetical protein
MRTIDDVRHDRLLELIQEAGSIQALADKLGKSHSQISQLKTRARRGEGRKSVGTTLAREIERTLGKPEGWMDTDPKACCTGAATEYPERGANPPPEISRGAAWRSAANTFAEVVTRAKVNMDPETFLLFVDAAIEETQREIDEAAAEQVLKRWLPILSRGRGIGHAGP